MLKIVYPICCGMDVHKTWFIEDEELARRHLINPMRLIDSAEHAAAFIRLCNK